MVISTQRILILSLIMVIAAARILILVMVIASARILILMMETVTPKILILDNSDSDAGNCYP